MNRFRHPILWIYLFLAGITLVAFGQVYRHEFITLDDPTYIINNPLVQSGLTWESATAAFSTVSVGFWQPLLILSFQLDASLYGADSAWGFHLTNLFWHLADVLLVFHLLFRMTKALGRSAMVATLFAIHPMHVESVAWITERKDVLSAFFWLMALWAYLHYVARPSIGRYLLIFATLTLSLMVKPMGVTFPCVLLLLDFWPLKRVGLQGGGEGQPSVPPTSWSWLALEKMPLLALGLAFSALTVWTHREYLGSPLAVMSLQRRLGNAVVFYGWYVEKTFLPFNLGLYYAYPPLDQLGWKVAVALMVLGSISGLVWHWRRRQPALMIGWLWFLGMLFPVIGLLTQGESVADRWTYLPHIGFFLGLVWGLADLATWLKCPTGLRWAFSGVVFIFLLRLTWIQTGYWQTSLPLWEHAYEINGGYFHTHMHLGLIYHRQNEFEKAEFHYRKALGFKPFHIGYEHLASLVIKKNNFSEAELLLRAALHEKPNYERAAGMLGIVLVKRNQFAEAIPYLERYTQSSAAKEPESIINEVYEDLGLALLQLSRRQEAVEVLTRAVADIPDLTHGHHLLGLALRDLGKLDEAQAPFLKAIQLQPNFPEACNNLGITLCRLQKWPEATDFFRQAIKLNPKEVRYRCNLAYGLFQQGQSDQASQEYRLTLQSNPDWPQVANNRALSMATNADLRKRDLVQALELAQQMCQATDFTEPQWLDTLALAYAANCRFEEARATAQQALALAPAPDLVRQLLERPLPGIDNPNPRSYPRPGTKLGASS